MARSRFLEELDQCASMQPLPVPIVEGRDLGRDDIRNIAVHRDALVPEDLSELHDLRLTAPCRTGFDGSRWAPDLGDAVACADACAHAGWLDLHALAAHVAEHPGSRGVVQARRAAQLADAAARSSWESRLRVLYVVEARLPRPEVNVPIFDVADNLVAIVDLPDENSGLVTEYDGQLHRERAQHRADNEREEQLETLGLTVVRADSLDMRVHRPRLVARLQDGYRRGLRRNRRFDAWTTVEPDWWLAAASPTS